MFTKSTAVSSLKVQTIAAGVLLAFGAGAQAAPSSGPSKTAQGTFVKLVTPAELAIEQNIQYRFDSEAAARLFTNAWDGASPALKCPNSDPTCANKPASPPVAPLALPSKTKDVVSANRCVWMNGGTLTGATYTQTATAGTGNSRYTYTYSYAVTPTSNPVAPKTAWVEDQILGSDAANLDISAQIAGESVLVSKQFAAPGKFSFSLLGAVDPLTGLPANRVANLVYTVTDQNGVAVSLPAASEVKPGIDLLIESYNGGTNGDATLLAPIGQTMSQILASDKVESNNNGGADGSAMAVAFVAPATFTLPAGDYTINLSGTVKGNDASANMPFNIEKKTKITYVGSACGQ